MDADELVETLLESIAGRRLAIIAGAGLSFAAPSNVPSAADVAKQAYDEHRRVGGPLLPADCEWQLERITSEFYNRRRLSNYFVECLVDWARFRTNPNRGHLAIADLKGLEQLTSAKFAHELLYLWIDWRACR